MSITSFASYEKTTFEKDNYHNTAT